MGFTEALTIVFVILKLLGIIQWGWFFVLSPEIIALAIYIVTLFAAIADGRGMRWYRPKEKKRDK